MPTEQEKPAKCPFCGSHRTGLFECDVDSWAAYCFSCKAIGPRSPSTGDAINRWNYASNWMSFVSGSRILPRTQDPEFPCAIDRRAPG